MSVGFGFSVGDFLAAVNLVATVIDALHESGSSSRRHQELIRQLYLLQATLHKVKELKLHETQNAQKIALHSAASQCQKAIEDFWPTIQKYHPHLGRPTRPSNLKAQWLKVKWVLFEEDEVEVFRNTLQAHTNSIDALMTACLLEFAAIEARKREQEHKSVMTLIQDSSNQWLTTFAQVSTNVTGYIQQGKDLMQMTASVLQTNVQIFQAVLDLQTWVKFIPGQISAQPVLFLDPLGGEPQHISLNFIQSFEAFRAVLKENFALVGVGVEKIDRGEFVLHDRFRKQDIDFNRPWKMCFRPGQVVEMSMLFRSSEKGNSCPTCGEPSDKKADEQVICSVCGTTFTRVVRFGKDEKEDRPVEKNPARFGPSIPFNFENSTGNSLNEHPEDITIFRRIRLSITDNGRGRYATRGNFRLVATVEDDKESEVEDQVPNKGTTDQGPILIELDSNGPVRDRRIPTPYAYTSPVWNRREPSPVRERRPPSPYAYTRTTRTG